MAQPRIIRVAEVMSRDLLTITENESLLMAWDLMRKTGWHHLPVFTVEADFLGVLEAAVVAARWPSGGPDAARRPVTGLLSDAPAVRPTDPLQVAAELMWTMDSDHVIVTDDDGRLVGLLTSRDLIAHLAGVERPDAEKEPRPITPTLYRIDPVFPRDSSTA